MSALGKLTAASGFDDVAEAIIGECVRRGYTRAETIACLSTAIQESGLRPGAVSANGKWVGIYQQDTSYLRRGDPNENIREFLNRLDVKRASPGASADPWLNIFWLQQRPGENTADAAYRNGRKAYLTEIQSRTSKATELYNRFGGQMPAAGGVGKPAYNEFPIWSVNHYNGRNGVTVDMFILHTSEGFVGNDAAAEQLSRWYQGPAAQVAYHYAVSQASDGGVTVVDNVDTDDASWSALSANNRSINLCFAGTQAVWTRGQWISKFGNAIDVAAYLAVADCQKYRIPTTVIAPPYTGRIPGITDHRYVSKVLGDGTHTDVGDGFPWDVFTTSVNKYASGLPPEVPVVVAKQLPQDLTDRQLWEDLWTQQRGMGGKGWSQLGKNDKGEDLTPVDALAEILARLERIEASIRLPNK